jgi:prepilin-type N-terminal cleavage/methylation domain-containing protein
MDNKQDKGFTLVELLIVIVILGILATVTVFAVRGITDQGQTNGVCRDKKTLETAVEAYYARTATSWERRNRDDPGRLADVDSPINGVWPGRRRGPRHWPSCRHVAPSHGAGVTRRCKCTPPRTAA